MLVSRRVRLVPAALRSVIGSAGLVPARSAVRAFPPSDVVPIVARRRTARIVVAALVPRRSLRSVARAARLVAPVARLVALWVPLGAAPMRHPTGKSPAPLYEYLARLV